MDKDVYKLNGRCGEEHALIRKEEGWLLVTAHSIRLIYNDDKIEAVDPEGGPFIRIGDKVYDNVIQEFKVIDNKLYIIF
jgi:hypothetical protein